MAVALGTAAGMLRVTTLFVFAGTNLRIGFYLESVSSSSKYGSGGIYLISTHLAHKAGFAKPKAQIVMRKWLNLDRTFHDPSQSQLTGLIVSDLPSRSASFCTRGSHCKLMPFSVMRSRMFARVLYFSSNCQAASNSPSSVSRVIILLPPDRTGPAGLYTPHNGQVDTVLTAAALTAGLSCWHKSM